MSAVARVPGHVAERARPDRMPEFRPRFPREDHREKTMKIQELIKTQSELLWRFMGFFQNPFLRVLHALVVLFVILQLCSSTLMRVTPDGASWTTWYHMLEGMSLCVLGVILAAYSLGKHGLKYFFPYLWGDVEQIRKDLISSLHGQLVAPRPGGLATSVQGLGLGALLLTAFSGLTWFWLWRDGSPAAHGWRVAHEWIAWLLIVYLIGHGGMALLHFFVWQRRVAKK